MKRLVQVWMVAVALVVGAQAAQAAPIAQFTWEEICDDVDPPGDPQGVCLAGATNLIFSLLGGGTIEGLTVIVDGGALDPLMTLTSLAPLADQSFNLEFFLPQTIQSVSVAFDHITFGNVTQAFADAFVRADLNTGGAPDYVQLSRTYERQSANIPEPASLSLLGLGVAAAAVARRRRR